MRCLSYDGRDLLNSHVRPLLQVIDDAGTFQGWVGAEVGPTEAAPGPREASTPAPSPGPKRTPARRS